jgi:hypothetical protein
LNISDLGRLRLYGSPKIAMGRHAQQPLVIPRTDTHNLPWIARNRLPEVKGRLRFADLELGMCGAEHNRGFAATVIPTLGG